MQFIGGPSRHTMYSWSTLFVCLTLLGVQMVQASIELDLESQGEPSIIA